MAFLDIPLLFPVIVSIRFIDEIPTNLYQFAVRYEKKAFQMFFILGQNWEILILRN